MTINDIHIKNYRAYKEFECAFSDGVNLIIGDNGVGKTSLLTAVTQIMSVQFLYLGVHISIEPADPHIEIQTAGDSTLSILENYPMIIFGNFTDGEGKKFDCGIERSDSRNSSVRGVMDSLRKYTEQQGVLWPLISYQRFDRDWKLGKNTSKSITVETGFNERKDGYKDCLVGIGQEDKIQRWCLKMSMLEYERKRKIHEFERFKYLVKVFLKSIEDSDEDFEVSYSTEFSGLVIRRENNIQPLYELSTGYKALLSMIMELAYRTVLLNPDADIEDKNQNGIVVIDEIDAHLHPKWQWRIIDALQSCFPKVQFIIATHSPIVISSAKKARLIDLEENGKVFYSDGAYGYNVADVLELKQGSASMSKASALYMDRLEKAIDGGNTLLAKKIIAEAEIEFGPGSPVCKELKDYLEVNQWVEEDE